MKPIDLHSIWSRYFSENVMKAAWNPQSPSKGQATIPKVVRDHLRLKPGDRVKFFIHPNGGVVVLPKLPVSSLRWIVKKTRRKPPTIEEVDEAIAAGAVERFLHQKRQ